MRIESPNEEQTLVDGWAIFYAKGSSANANGLRPYQLQKYDDKPRDFKSDSDAWEHVWKNKEKGIYKQALDFLEKESNPEWQDIREHCESKL
jgi:hypothetical protein